MKREKKLSHSKNLGREEGKARAGDYAERGIVRPEYQSGLKADVRF